MNLYIEDNNDIEMKVNQPDEIDFRAGDTINIAYSDYEELTNKPKINDVELVGNKSLSDIGAAAIEDIPTVPTKVSQLQNDSGFITGYTETDPTVPSWAKASSKPTYTASEVGALPDDTVIPTVPTDVSAFNNDAGYLTSESDPTVPAWAKEENKPSYTASEVGALPDTTTIPTKTSDLNNDALFAKGHIGNFHGTCASSASATAKVVTCADFTSSDLVAGAIIVVEFDNTNSGAVGSLTLNVNGTGAYGIKRNNSGTIGSLDSAGYIKGGSSYMFYFDGSHWVMTAYDTNTNTIGYTIRHNGASLAMANAMYRYRIMFTSADGENYVSANASTSTSATASKTVTTLAIDPFGEILYYSTTTAVSAGNRPAAANCTQQYNGVTLGYSFNRTGTALTLTSWKPVYVKCTPQADGSAIIDPDTPFTQAMPTTNDGKIYIFLGIATSATAIEFILHHPVYYHNGTGIRLWTGGA